MKFFLAKLRAWDCKFPKTELHPRYFPSKFCEIFQNSLSSEPMWTVAFILDVITVGYDSQWIVFI